MLFADKSPFPLFRGERCDGEKVELNVTTSKLVSTQRKLVFPSRASGCRFGLVEKSIAERKAKGNEFVGVVSSFCDIVIGEVFSENVIHEGDNDLEHSGTETQEQLAGTQEPTQNAAPFARVSDHLDCCTASTSQRRKLVLILPAIPLQQNNRIAGNTLSPPRETKRIGRRCFHTHPLPLHVQMLRQVAAHRRNMGIHNRRINIADTPLMLPADNIENRCEKHLTWLAFPTTIVGGKVRAKIAKGRRTQQCINERMGQRITIRVPIQPSLVGNGDPSQHQQAIGREGMYIPRVAQRDAPLK